MAIFLPNTLHGPPRLGGTLFPKAAMETPVEGTPVDVSRYKTMASGTVKMVGVERYRVRWTLGWTRYLTASQFTTLLAVLEDRGGFAFEPRTINEDAGDDPGATVPSYTVRLVGDLPSLTRPLYDEYYDAPRLTLETVGILEGT